jgi:hypothetical protein
MDLPSSQHPARTGGQDGIVGYGRCLVLQLGDDRGRAPVF